ncbi:glutamyl-tRNA reductase [soil metagenome]
MNRQLVLIRANASAVPAEQRAQLADRLRALGVAGGVLLETCHRVELYADGTLVADLAPDRLPAGTEWLWGRAAEEHLLRLAVGRESAIVAEDQLLHQLRGAVQQARSRSPLRPEMDRLFDVALRAGRRARSWLPSRRPSLAELALERALQAGGPPAGPVLVVGAGEMGRRAARALAGRDIELVVSSRTPERAAGLAARLGVRSVPFDPGPELARVLGGALLALGGPWQPAEATQTALLESRAWVVDLSAPACLPDGLAARLGRRLTTIDDLAVGALTNQPSPALIDSLDRLVEEALDEYMAWAAHESQRNAARALSEKADQAQAAELDALWQRMPHLADDQREEVERMARHLTDRLLRDPLERLQQDGDGRHASAARELFRL